jgi:polysaccharide deacetylase 2 family uncharacterized protein YibQ
MSDNRAKRRGPFGLSPLALTAAALLLVILGMSGGVILDVMLRPEPPVRHPEAVSHHAPPPTVIRTPEDSKADSRMPSITAARPPSAEPVVERQAAAPMVPVVAPPPEKPVVEKQVAEVPIVEKAVAEKKAAEKAVSPPAPVAAKVPKEKQPMTAYAKPSTADADSPAIAIVIDDMGLDRVHTAEVLDMTEGLTVSIMSYAADAAGLAARALGRGHEVLAHVPMQPMNTKEDAGPGALTVAMDADTIRATLAANLDKWDGYVGVNNHMGSRFTGDSERMAAVMTELKARGLLWLDSRTTAQSAGPGAAQAAGVPYVTRDIFLDNVDTVAAVVAELEKTIAVAKSRGTAIAIGHPHANTIAALKQILPTLKDRGIALVPVTEILKRQQAGSRPS